MNTTSIGGWISSHKGVTAGIAGFVAVIFVVIASVSWYYSVDNDGYRRQREVVQQYNAFQNELSTCLDNTRLSGQIASTEYDKYKDIMTSIVAARYVDENGNVTRAGGALGSGQFISMLQEQYPQIDKSLWKQMMTKATGCREQVKGVNNKLQYVAASFDTWRSTGVASRFIRNNWPDDRLKVQSMEGPLTGEAALEFLTTPITTSDAQKALRTHTMPDQSKELELFPTGK